MPPVLSVPQQEVTMDCKREFREWVQPEPQLTAKEWVLVAIALSISIFAIFTMASVSNYHGGHYTLASSWWGEVVTNFFFGK